MTEDIKAGYMNIARRLQSVSKSQGLQIITISMLVDRDGNVKFWTEPHTRKIEPRGNWQDILQLLTDNDLSA